MSATEPVTSDPGEWVSEGRGGGRREGRRGQAVT